VAKSVRHPLVDQPATSYDNESGLGGTFCFAVDGCGEGRREQRGYNLEEGVARTISPASDLLKLDKFGPI